MRQDTFHKTRVLKAPSSLALNTDREGEATASLGNLGQGLTTLTGKNAWSDIGTGCPGKWLSPHPWRCSKNMYMWHLGTWFGRHGGVGLTVGLDDLRGLFQPMILLFLLISDLNLPSSSLKPLCLVLALQALVKSPSPALSQAPSDAEGSCSKVSPEPSLLQAEQPQLSGFLGHLL